MFKINTNKYSVLSFYTILVSALVGTLFFINWAPLNHPFTMDVNQYYCYLNALFIEHDLTFKVIKNGYWLIETPTHDFVPKVTYGIAFFYAPFYLIANAFSAKGASGYEPIYSWLIHYGCIIYVMLGLWFTRKTLLFFFNETVTSISILLLFFGTNLFYYTLSESESVHGILFFLISVYIYHVIKWHKKDSFINFLCFMFIAGFICLIRPTECILLLFPLLIGISKLKDFQIKFQKIIQLKYFLFFGFILFLMPLFPQFLYWKMQSGNFLFFSYGSSERFFWNDPQIINVFFSFRKGFFIYTPIMTFSVIGFFILYLKNKTICFPIILYFLINSYLVCSWWDWSYGGSFGMRAFVHGFAILIIPFAYFINWVMSLYKKSVIKTSLFYSVTFVSLFFCLLNIFQSNLYKHRIIHFDGMTKEAYVFTFMKKNYTKQDLEYLNTQIKSPDYEARKRGNRD